MGGSKYFLEPPIPNTSWTPYEICGPAISLVTLHFQIDYTVECTVGVVGVTCVCTGAYNISSVGLFDACLCGKQTASGHLGRYGR